MQPVAILRQTVRKCVEDPFHERRRCCLHGNVEDHCVPIEECTFSETVFWIASGAFTTTTMIVGYKLAQWLEEPGRSQCCKKGCCIAQVAFWSFVLWVLYMALPLSLLGGPHQKAPQMFVSFLTVLLLCLLVSQSLSCSA